MKKILLNLKLKSQLILVSLTTVLIATISMMIILPSSLTPFYEKNLYEMLKQPLPFITGEHTKSNQRMAYIITKDKEIIISRNFSEIADDVDVIEILKLINLSHGKLKIDDHVFYYQTSTFNNMDIICFADDSYIEMQKASLNMVIFPIMILTLFITLSILIAYSNYLVRKVEKIKHKIDHFNDNNYNHQETFDINDELKTLILAIEQARMDLISREKYKNNMFQNISHELKTPIMVISSHVEAAMDKAIPSKEALTTIKEEVDNLSKQVEVILQLNKINYMKDTDGKFEEVNLTQIIHNSVKRFKVMRSDIKWDLTLDKEITYFGNKELWQMVIDNMLSNFIRFADKEIKIEYNKDKLVLANDGEKIDDALLKDIFEPYQKSSSKGLTGLGLSIVKECLDFMKYKIMVNNGDTGVNFIIVKKDP